METTIIRTDSPKSGHGGRRLEGLRRFVRGRRAPIRATVICEECELTGGPFEPAEAEHLRGLHDQLHHGILPPAVPHSVPGAFGDAAGDRT